MSETLDFRPVLQRLDLVAPPVANLFRTWQGRTPVDQIWVAEIDPASSGGSEFCHRYGFDDTEGANCVVIVGQRGATKTTAAVVTPVGRKSDFNGVVRRHLGARQVSLGPIELVLTETQMEYGSITPVGLPSSWPVLLDPAVANAPRIVIGSGLKRSKLSLPGAALRELPAAVVIEGVALPVTDVSAP